MKVIKIRWRDAARVDGQWNVKDAITLAEKESQTVFTSVGFLIAKTKHAIVIARELDGDDCRGALCIPRAMILSMRTLR